MAQEAATSDEKPAKKGGMIMTILGVVVLTLIGAGGGWAVGGMVAPNIKAAEGDIAAKEAAKAEETKKAEAAGLPRISTEANNIVQLEPVTSNLAYPSENWVRLEVALMFKGAPDAKLAEEIHQDILSYIRTVSLQQIEGPRGFQFLRDDIQERVDLRAQGRVSRIMFRTFVIE